MKLYGYQHHHNDNPWDDAPAWAIELLALMEINHMAISAEIQAVLDGIAKNTSLVQSVDAALKAEAAQIADLQAQIAALTAGTVLSADDKAALVQAAADLAATNTELQADVPANTPAPTP